MPLFESVSYHLSQSLVERTRLEISRILDSNGAKEVPIDLATYILSDTIEFEGCDTLRKGVPCVTPYWVERSMELGHLQDPKYFLADKGMFFSGIVAASADLPPGDKEVIASGILAQGGAWREGLTRDVTHLFVTNTRSEKYRTAMHFRNSAHITIVLPQWFDQCWSTQMRLPSDVFQFPDPPYLRKDHDVAAYKAQLLVKTHAEGSQHLSNGLDKKAMYGTMQVAVTSSSPAPRARNVWQGRSILLSPFLELDAQRRESLGARIQLAGGLVVSAHEEDESLAVDQADILITRFRSGAAYAKALVSGKTIGTLAWLFYVERTGIMSRPRDQLLHYPVRDKPIHGFKDHEITVTNYQGDAREYLKKLIEIMGAKFTPTMSGRNTVVIAAYKSGNKTAKAEEWSVPVVTHKWLEDCFVEWRNLTPAQKRYLDYAPGVNYGTILGDRGVGRVGLKDETEFLPENKEPARPKDQPGQPNPGVGQKPDMVHTNGGGLTGTTTSMRDALEVDEVEGVLHIAGHPHESHSDAGKGPSLSPTKWGPPRGIKKSPSKNGAQAEVLSAKPKSLPRPDTDTADSLPFKEAQGPPDSGSNAQLPQTDLSPDPAPVKGNSPMRRVGSPTRSRPFPTPTTKPMAQLDNDDESVVEVPPMETHAKASRGKQSPVLGTVVVTSSRSMPKVQKPHVASTLGGDKGSTDELGPKNSKGKAKAVYVVDTDEKSDRDVFMSHTKPKSKSKPIVYKAKSRARPVQGEGGKCSHPDEASHKTGSKVDGEKSATKAKNKRASSTSGSENDDDIELLVPNKVSRLVGSVNKRNREDVLLPSPNRIVSVDLPDPRSLLASRRHGSSPESTAPLPKSTSRLTKPRDRKSSIRVITSATSSSPPKRDRLIIDPVSPSRSPTPPTRRSPRPRSGSTPDPRDVVTFRSDTPPPVQRMSHRHAAITATQRLRTEVMPDLVNFETERRRSTKGGPGRKRKSAQFVVSGDDEEGEEQTDESRDRKKRKVITFDDDKGKGKGKPLVRVYAEDSDGPSTRFVTNAKARKRLADDDDKLGPEKRSGEGEVHKKIRRDRSVPGYVSEDHMTPGQSSYDPRKIRVLTTKVMVTEQIEKAMTKLGVRFTQKPQECTHLVTNHLSRTEKFLCALPNVPFILSMDWLVACAESGRIVAESGYPLRDPDMEHKHKFKLVEALERAKELKRNKQKLLQGHFFYVTPGVPSDFNVLKNVLRALGAEGKMSVPTIRNISETRHVISSLKDESLWRPLIKHGVTIYSHELILGAAFTQFVDWDGEDKILARES